MSSHNVEFINVAREEAETKIAREAEFMFNDLFAFEKVDLGVIQLLGCTAFCAAEADLSKQQLSLREKRALGPMTHEDSKRLQQLDSALYAVSLDAMLRGTKKKDDEQSLPSTMPQKVKASKQVTVSEQAAA